MKRRNALVVGFAVAFSAIDRTFVAYAEQKIPRIGYLITGSLESSEARAVLDSFRERLRELGYIEGQNIVVEVRSADDKVERFPRLASELVRLDVDLILAASPPAARAAQEATRTIPIVVTGADPVQQGLAASLAKPGGNITGSTFLATELIPKRLQLLKETLPRDNRVAVLVHPDAYGERATNQMLKEAEAEARALGLQLQVVKVHGPEDLERALSEMARARTQALIVFHSPMFLFERRRLVELAGRLPSVYFAREFVELGGLMSYGPSVRDLIRRSADYVDKILKGAKPGDLPVQQPTKFELVINLRTAQSLGLTIPQALLVRADEVIQ